MTPIDHKRQKEHHGSPRNACKSIENRLMHLVVPQALVNHQLQQHQTRSHQEQEQRLAKPLLQNQQLHDHHDQIRGGAAIADPEGIHMQYLSSVVYAMTVQTVLQKAVLERRQLACLQAIPARHRRQV